MTLEHFNIAEFDSPDSPGSGEFMSKKFLIMLDKARDIAGIPFKINSGYRTMVHNAEIGGVSNSSHLSGLAADVSCKESRHRFIMIAAFIAAGFTRIGIAKTFIHVDCDKDKDQSVSWVY
jgi:uncharacterized protein YcbK (DUF882 family)